VQLFIWGEDYSSGAYPPLLLLKCMLLQKCLWPGGFLSGRIATWRAKLGMGFASGSEGPTLRLGSLRAGSGPGGYSF